MAEEHQENGPKKPSRPAPKPPAYAKQPEGTHAAPGDEPTRSLPPYQGEIEITVETSSGLTGVYSEQEPKWKKIESSSEESFEEKFGLRKRNKKVGVTSSRLFTSEGRHIDYVLVYEEKMPKRALPGAPADPDFEAKMIAEEMRQERRREFEDHLMDFHGLILERVKASDPANPDTVYVLVTVPFDRLCAEAEYVQLNKALKFGKPEDKFGRSKWLNRLRNFLGIFKAGVDDVPRNKMPHADFHQAQLSSFEGSDNPETFFRHAERIELAYSILTHAKWGKNFQKSSRGIQKLIARGYYLDAYPLHAGPTYKPLMAKSDKQNELKTLYENWAKKSLIFKAQPLGRIRNYFGEKIAYYFQWLGFYTAWLLPPSLVGLCCFIYGLTYAYDSIITTDICSSNKTICANNELSEAYNLSDTCNYARFSAVFDNDATIYFTLFMSLWGVFFVEFWKRKSAVKAYKWNVVDFEEEELPRPNFRGNKRAHNPVTGRMEPYYSATMRRTKLAGSLSVLAFMIVIVLGVVFGVILYRLSLSLVMSRKGDDYRETGPILVSVTAAVLNLVGILLLSFVYNKLAYRLTEWENHRTETDYDDALTFKLYVFNFVNNYSSIFYIAFFKGKFTGIPTDPQTMFGVPVEGCAPSGCMAELTIQLLIIMLGRQLFSAIIEIGIPYLMSYFSIYKSRKEAKEQQIDLKLKELPQWEMDFYLNCYPGLFDEYMELVVQFGFITLFVTGLPLAPLFAFVNNIFEIRLDALKFICTYRRPPPTRSQDIGTWAKIVSFLVRLAIIINGAIIAFTTEYVSRWRYSANHGGSLQGYVDSLYSYSAPTAQFPNGSQVNCYFRGYYTQSGQLTSEFWEQMVAVLAFLIVYEGVVFVVVYAASHLIPDRPAWLKLAQKRHHADAKKHLLGYKYDDSDISPNEIVSTNPGPSAPGASAEKSGPECAVGDEALNVEMQQLESFERANSE
eukprot:comp23001_c0_seq1/m.36670 comp23001_c0_seq1/g.36670  ORF comp23001_c0_seq1/g.36670 comp23001_c0_seq1/m.36670 type:complete len:961 (-) comp23001_c0_seq1:920-3802(-)